MRKLLLSTLVGLFAVTSGFSQQRSCGTMEYLQWLKQQDPNLEQRMQEIETYTQNWIAAHPEGLRTVVTIPVVVHVVYNTTSQNISDALVQAQIDQLNADFARTNSDAGNTPSVWQSTAVNTEIQFCLAQRDPNGNATNGIVRKSTTKTSFTYDDKIKYTSQGGDDAWSSSSYLNLWVGNLSSGLLGYAQFPGGNAATDGVVVKYNTVGSIATPGSGSPYNLGRTATHEVGHWLNLYHIWGDDGTACTGSDQVSDTPNQAGENYGCPTFPKTDGCTSGNGVMFMNYMDYTDDACMNMFTSGQKTRMQALFDVGGSRVSITTSAGCTPPAAACTEAPIGLSATAITESSATISWNTLSGATSYNIQYKPSSSGTWTTTTSSSTSKVLTGLTASTPYDYQIQGVCSSGTSPYSSVATFTTTAPGGGCSETGETGNNSKNTPSSATVGTSYLSQISSSTDVDWWSFANTSTAKNIKITLTTLPADYDIKLYKSNGTTLLKTSQNGGTTSETIIYNTSTVATYKIKVYGYAGAYSTSQCYTLLVQTSSSPFRFSEGESDGELNADKSEISVFPNPAFDNLTVQFTSASKADAAVTVYNLLGQRVYANSILALEGQNQYSISLDQFGKGVYVVEVNNGDQLLRKEFVVTK